MRKSKYMCMCQQKSKSKSKSKSKEGQEQEHTQYLGLVVLILWGPLHVQHGMWRAL